MKTAANLLVAAAAFACAATPALAAPMTGYHYDKPVLQSDRLLDRVAQMNDQVRRADFHGRPAVRLLNRLQDVRQDILLARRQGVLTPVADRTFAQRLDNLQFQIDHTRRYRA